MRVNAPCGMDLTRLSDMFNLGYIYIYILIFLNFKLKFIFNLYLSNFERLKIKFKAYVRDVGTMGPGSVPLANRPSPRAPMGPSPKASRRRKVSKPRYAQATLRPGARAPLIPDASFPDVPKCPDASFPDQRLHQTKFPTSSS